MAKRKATTIDSVPMLFKGSSELIQTEQQQKYQQCPDQ